MASLQRSLLPLSLVATILTTAAHAQDFNLDVGFATGNPPPTAAYGGAAARPGVWSIAPIVAGAPVALTDITGAATGVTSTMSGGSQFESITNLSGATTDEIRLMSDVMDPDTGPQTWTFSNLANGTYDLYTYAMAPDNATFRTNVSVAGSSDPAQDVGGAWPNAYVQGVTHARHRVTVTGGSPVVITVWKAASPPAAQNYASVNGFQIVRVPPSNGSAFCAGDGIDVTHSTQCPCANNGAAGNGCANSVNPAGANLAITGAVLSDDVVLHASGMPLTVNCIYLQGDGLDDAVFGDGVRCTGGTLVRLRTKLNAGGASSFPDSTDTLTLSQRGGVVVGGGATRYYQTYYRNSATGFCPPETFNVTNGWVITW